MDESQPRKQQSWSRNRLTADGQTSRRPRAVAGQRAAAKRAAQPAQQHSGTGQLVEPREPAESLAVPDEQLAPTDNADSAERAASTSGTVSDDRATSADGTESAERGTSTKRTTSVARTTRTTRRAVVTAVLAVAVIAEVAVGAIFTVQYRNAIRTDHARTAAVAAAERAAPVIFSYDYRHLDHDFGKAESYLTGAFRDQYAKTTQTVVKPTALQYHGVVQATVAKPADGSAAAVSVVSAAPDQVVVLAFIDQSTTSTRVTGTQVDQNRVLLTLTHTSQGWLVSAVDAL